MYKRTQSLSIDPNDYFFKCRTFRKILCQCPEWLNITCLSSVRVLNTILWLLQCGMNWGIPSIRCCILGYSCHQSSTHIKHIFYLSLLFQSSRTILVADKTRHLDSFLLFNSWVKEYLKYADLVDRWMDRLIDWLIDGVIVWLCCSSVHFNLSMPWPTCIHKISALALSKLITNWQVLKVLFKHLNGRELSRINKEILKELMASA